MIGQSIMGQQREHFSPLDFACLEGNVSIVSWEQRDKEVQSLAPIPAVVIWQLCLVIKGLPPPHIPEASPEGQKGVVGSLRT